MRENLLMKMAICVGLSRFACASRAADWPMFRGADRSGVSTEKTAPLTWSVDQNIKWKVSLPAGGNSSPVVFGDYVFLNCAEDERGVRRSLSCFNRADGTQLWVKTVTYDRPDPHHAANPYCASSPAVDTKHVVVWHGSAGLHCYDHEGNTLWSCDLGVIRHIWGYGGSPVILNDRVIVNGGPGVRSFVAAVDLNTGKRIWQTDEPGGAEDRSPETKSWLGSWSTPVIAKIDGREQILVSMPRHVNAYDPSDGKILWTCEGTGDLAYCDPVVSPELNVCVMTAGYGGRAIGFKPGGSGDVTASHRLWQSTGKPPQRIGTGVILGKYLYLAQEPGFICMDPMTGRTIWEHREPGQIFWGSLVAVGERLYVTSQKGTTFAFAADPAGYRLLAKNELGEKSNSTIAVSNGQIFLRTYDHLYCIEEKSDR